MPRTSLMMRLATRPRKAWSLDCHRRPIGEAHRLDHVGIERTLLRELRSTDLLRLGLVRIDKQRVDRLELRFGIGGASERVGELLARIGVDQQDDIAAPEIAFRLRQCNKTAHNRQ